MARHSRATPLTHANVLRRKLGATDTNGLSARTTGEAAYSGIPTSLNRPAATKTGITDRSPSPTPALRQLSRGASSSSNFVPGGGSQFVPQEAPDPTLLPTLLRIAMEKLEREVAACVGCNGVGVGANKSGELCN